MDSCGVRRGTWAVFVASVLAVRPAVAAPVAAPAAAPAPAAEPAPAAGDDVESEAQRLFAKGAEAYNLGRFDVAIESFERAYELSQANPLLYNIAQAYTKLYDVELEVGHLRKAKMLFLNFAKLAEATGEDPRDARARVVKIDEQIAGHEAKVEEERRRAEVAEREKREAETRRIEAEAQLAAAQRYKPRSLGIAGWTLFGVGMIGGWTLGSIGGRSVLVLNDQRAAESMLPLDPERAALYDANVRKAGVMSFTAGAVGFLLVVAGIAMITVDAVKTRRSLRRAALVPGGFSVAF